MDKINLGDGTQGSGDSGFVGGGKINANYIALVEAILGVTIWSSATSENLDLTTLNTTDKSSIKAAINELLERTKLIDDSLTSSVFKTWSVDKLVATFIQASALADYLQLAGGTLTGTLNGTSASFTSNVDISHVGSGGSGTVGIGECLNISSYTPNITFNDISSSVDNYAIHSNQNVFTIGRYTSSTSQSSDLVLKSGNVGIGTDSPSERLEVNGNAKATKFITGQLEINSDSNATNIVSDDQNLYIKSDHTSGNVRLLADAAVYVQTGSNEDLAITASSSSGVGLWHIGSKKIGTTNTGASVTGNLEASGTVLSETNNVQTITGSTSAATIGADINVVVVDTTVNCTLTISTAVNVASIKVINIGTGSTSFGGNTDVTINNILDGSTLGSEFSATLTKIATNSWIVSE